MPITKCSEELVASITKDCDESVVAGLLADGLVFNASQVELVRDAANPRKITGITMVGASTPYQIYNPTNIPFADTANELSTDSAYPTWNKTVNFLIPNNGADASKDIIEPISKNRDGFIFVLPTKNKTGDGGFVIIGSEGGAIASAGTRNYTDTATNGMYSATLVETAANYETVVLSGADYDAAKATYDALVALAPTPA